MSVPKHRSLRAGALVLFAMALAGATGCAKTPQTRFYILSPLPPSAAPKDVSTARAPLVGLRPVTLPEQLDRPEIVTRSGANVLQLAEFDQWAAPLRDSFSRVLAEDLAILVPADRVVLFPWARESSVDYEVIVDVVRFDGALGADAQLVADWTIARRGAKTAPVTKRSSHTEPAGGTYADLVSAQSRLVAALGRDIASALQAMPR
jgi:uncharacterized lipoprotein YmbA